jgi:hypothetical protein
MGNVELIDNNAFENVEELKAREDKILKSLKYHKDNTKNLDEFINSVGNFLKTTDTELTENDIKRLKIHYEKY